MPWYPQWDSDYLPPDMKIDTRPVYGPPNPNTPDKSYKPIYGPPRPIDNSSFRGASASGSAASSVGPYQESKYNRYTPDQLDDYVHQQLALANRYKGTPQYSAIVNQLTETIRKELPGISREGILDIYHRASGMQSYIPRPGQPFSTQPFFGAGAEGQASSNNPYNGISASGRASSNNPFNGASASGRASYTNPFAGISSEGSSDHLLGQGATMQPSRGPITHSGYSSREGSVDLDELARRQAEAVMLPPNF